MAIEIGTEIQILTLINNYLGSERRCIVARVGDTAFIKKIVTFMINGNEHVHYYAVNKKNLSVMFMVLPSEFFIEEVPLNYASSNPYEEKAA